MDVLFLSVSMGGGHVKAAESIKECVLQYHPGSRALIIDTLNYVNPIIDKLIVGSYLNTVKKTPQLYGKLYELSEWGENINDLSKAVNKLLSFKVKSLINEFKPSIIVCTHPFPLHMVSNMKMENKMDIPIVAVLTDMVAHSLWIHGNVDAYIVSHDFMKQEMKKKGVSEALVHPIGIPVSECFLSRKNKAALLREFGLEDKLTILMMGGSLGFGEIKDTFKSILKSSRDPQIIVLTGKNMKLKRQLEKYSFNTSKMVKILGYTNRVSDFMDVSDFIITKPGGLTVSEALIKGLPMFIISPIPGQEEANSHFLLNNGVAVRILPGDDIDSILCQVADNPLRLKHMKEMARYLAKPHACTDTVKLLEKLTERYSAAMA